MRISYVLLLMSILVSVADAQQWIRSFNSGGTSIDETRAVVASGGLTFLIGSSLDVTQGWNAIPRGSDVRVVAVDSAGNTAWTMTHDGSAHADDNGFCASVAGNGDLVVAGCTWNALRGWDYLLLRISRTGVLLWSRMWDGPASGDDLATAVCTDAQGSVYVTGMSKAMNGRWSPVTLKYSSTGSLLWTARADSSNDTRPTAIALDPAGSVIVGATTGNTATSITLLKYSISGILQWSRTTTGGGAMARVNAIATLPDASVCIAGMMATAGGQSDALVVAFSSSGWLEWTHLYDGSGFGSDEAIAIAADAAGNVFVTAASNGAASGKDIATLKIRQDGTRLWVSRYAGPAQGGDIDPPIFGGVSGATQAGQGAVMLHWAPAEDDVSRPNAIRYRIYTGSSPGAENFSTPAQSVADVSTMLEGLATGSVTYVVVRAVDESGNEDANLREISITPSPPQARILLVTRDTVMTAGEYWYDRIMVQRSATLRLLGDVMLSAHDTLAILGNVESDCHALTLRCDGQMILDGRISNRCVTGDSMHAGALSILAPGGSLRIDSTSAMSGVFSHGVITLTSDTTFAPWMLAIPPFGRTTAPVDPTALLACDVSRTLVSSAAPLDVRFTAHGADPDGGPVTFDLDYGDGTSAQGIVPSNEDEAVSSRAYTSPGIYRAVLTVHDNDGRTSSSSLQFVIADSGSADAPALSCAIDAADMTARIQDSVGFTAIVRAGPRNTVDSVVWDFGDGATAVGTHALHAFAAQGLYTITLRGTDDSGSVAMSTMRMYVYKADTARVASVKGKTIEAVRPRVTIAAPIFGRAGTRVYFNGEDVQFDPGSGILGANGSNGSPGRSGDAGIGFRMWSGGTLTVAGGVFAPGDGGAGSSGGRESHGRNGGNGGDMRFAGHDIIVSGGVFVGSAGGDGGDDTKTGGPGASANAIGGDGGKPGTVHFAASNSIDITAPIDILLGDGGNGGSATATGGDGQNRCPRGQDGGNATAHGGMGGMAAKTGVVAGAVTGVDNVTVHGSNGGRGGDATATGGAGGSATNCQTTATGGAGGAATASAGSGGRSGLSGTATTVTIAPLSFQGGDGGDAVANGGDGGSATAVGTPDPGADGCPAMKGGDATSTGGQGGSSTARKGRGGSSTITPGNDGSSTENGSDGGGATATGGAGGNGVGCGCAGGDGGKATSNAGMHGTLSGNADNAVPGSDGTSDAKGGNGGKGGDCCPPAQAAGAGGIGGNGGKAESSTGAAGQNTGHGGDAGNGGNGCPPGAAGVAGRGTGTPNTIDDGNAGLTGANCCALFPRRAIIRVSCTIPIIPGQQYSWDIYDSTGTTKRATMNVVFLTQQQLGSPVSYDCLAQNNDLGIGRGGVRFSIASIVDAANPQQVWTCIGLSLQFVGQGTGEVDLEGENGGVVIAQNSTPITANGSISLRATPGQTFDTVSLLSSGPIVFDFGWITGVFLLP